MAGLQRKDSFSIFPHLNIALVRKPRTEAMAEIPILG
jgi:hypothetical protein